MDFHSHLGVLSTPFTSGSRFSLQSKGYLGSIFQVPLTPAPETVLLYLGCAASTVSTPTMTLFNSPSQAGSLQRRCFLAAEMPLVNLFSPLLLSPFSLTLHWQEGKLSWSNFERLQRVRRRRWSSNLLTSSFTRIQILINLVGGI